jgi:hypothetical protein
VQFVHPFWPFSEAGSNTVATMRSILPAFSLRKASNARTVAAGCATTTGPGCNSGATGWPVWRSIQGERIDAPASSSSAYERSTMVSPRSRAAFQLLARGARVGSEESEVHALELLRADALDKVHLIAHRLQLTERFVVIEQPDIDGRKIPFAQNFGNLFSLERRAPTIATR